LCQQKFSEHGLKPLIAQANVAYNHRKDTLRGMHFQVPPVAETKLVRCTRGAILDIIVDLRPKSPTWLQHIEVELTEDNHRALFVPERFAHGYQVLTDRTETSYRSASSTAHPQSQSELDDAIAHDRPAVTDDWTVLTRSSGSTRWWT
jgi:dTDP-4-dehydrorhamnose 3,5-epimerase